jgi:hypothetical protein
MTAGRPPLTGRDVAGAGFLLGFFLGIYVVIRRFRDL